MRRALVIGALLLAAPALAQRAGDQPRLRCAACSLLPAGAVGADLTLTGALTAGGNVLAGNGIITLSGSGGFLYFNTTSGAAGAIISAMTAANAGATAASAAFKMYPDNALDATDWVFHVGTAANAGSLFYVRYDGTAVAPTSFVVGNPAGPGVSCSSGGGCSFASTQTYSGLLVGSSGSAISVMGQMTDSAGNIGVKLAPFNAFTSGVDRYPVVFYRDNATNAVARVFSNGTYQNLASVGTAASGTGVTATYSGASPYWLHKIVVTSAAMTAAASTDIQIVPATPANSAIRRIKADVTTKFIGGALTAVTLVCGNTAGGNQYLLSGDIFTNPIVLGDAAAEVGAGLLSATWADFGTAAAGTNGAITVTCRFTCTTANCNAATQGTVNFYVEGVTYF